LKRSKLHIELFIEVCATKISVSGECGTLKAGIAREFGALEVSIGKKARLPEADRFTKGSQPEVGRPGEFGLREVGIREISISPAMAT